MAGKADQGKIFINYRRSDSPGIAGRLADSLAAYFGEGRVFRDVEDIRGGDNFESVLDQTVDAADAVIVLIGPGWFKAVDDQGKRRLDDAHDWVAREISSAMEKDLPVFPVLIEDTPMPRVEDLPEPLKPLVKYNALHISDRRWAYDVRRVAKVVALDIPGSVEEKKLERIRLWVSLVLVLTLSGMVLRVALNALLAAGYFSFLTEFNAEVFSKTDFLSLREAAIGFIPIGASSLVLALAARMVDETRRRYVEVASWIGGAGTVLVYILVWPVPGSAESIFVFCSAGLIIAAMLFCMTLSGFKPR